VLFLIIRLKMRRNKITIQNTFGPKITQPRLLKSSVAAFFVLFYKNGFLKMSVPSKVIFKSF